MSTSSNETIENKDINQDGRVDVVTTTVEKIDVDGDETFDLVKTTVVGKDSANGDVVYFNTTLDSTNVDVDLSSVVNVSQSSQESADLMEQISELQGKIKCSSTQHLGTMSDYAVLFDKYQKFVAEAGDSNIELNLDVSELSKFADEASKFSAIFEDVSLRFQRISTVKDTSMLKKVKDELERVANMYDNIRKFQATITATSALQIPISVVTISEQLGVVSESIDCSLKFLNRFVDGEYQLTPEQEELAALDPKDVVAIKAAQNALDIWLEMIRNEASVTMSSNALIAEFRNKLKNFGVQADDIKQLTGKLEARLAKWRAGNFE